MKKKTLNQKILDFVTVAATFIFGGIALGVLLMILGFAGYGAVTIWQTLANLMF